MTDHWLIVPEAAEDGLDVEHPGDCPVVPCLAAPPELNYTEYDCNVEGYVAELGLPWRHRDEEPEEWRETTPLDPGRYRIEFWHEQVLSAGPWGGPEYDAGLCLVDEVKP